MIKKVMLVFGTRPEAIKMAPLCLALKKCPDLETLVCVTGQHREMLDQVMSVFGLVPDIDLDIMKKNQDLSDITSRILLNMREIFQLHKPDLLVVHGDTTTTMTSAMAAFYAGIPVAHVEAGLRTHDIMAPFPEEFNRRLASISAQFHFAPTALSKANLIAENISSEQVWLTGNTVIDALYWVIGKIENSSSLEESLNTFISSHLKFNWHERRYVLITGHRRENFGQGFLDICKAIKNLAEQHPTVHFVYPVHLNPNVQTPVNSLLGDLENVHLIQPLGYESFVYLLSKCYIVLTDSGGIQEEAPSLGKPVLVMRDVSERPEAIAAGTVKLVGTNVESIVENITTLIEQPDIYETMSKSHNPYGDGKACGKIVEIIKDQLNE
jgi:UDP-N-acetylglucosamine 2-epimerase (non-hydrolysing)